MIQETIINFILKPLANIFHRIDEKYKNVVFVLMGILMFLQYFLHGMQIVVFPYLFTYMVGCICMGIMILCGLRSDVRRVSFDSVLIRIWIILGILMLISALRFNVDWLSDALLILIACPIAYIVWGNMEQDKFLGLLTEVCLISFVIFLVISVIWYPIGEKQYSGLFSNVNGTAQYLTLVFACVLAKLYQNNGLLVRIWYSIVSGICIALLFYTNSRTGQLAAIVTFILTTILYCLKNTRKRLIGNVLPIILATIIFIPSTFYLIQAGNQLGRIISNFAIKYEGESLEKSIVEEDDDNNVIETQTEETQTEETQTEETQTEDIETGVEEFLVYNSQKTNVKGKSLDEISTGRVSIWKEYLKNIKLFGNGVEEKFWIESRGEYYSTAHMTLLTIAFRFGVVCAIVYFFYNILSGIKSVRFALLNEQKFALLPFTITISFGVTYLLASVNTPFYYMITMYYYFVQTVLITKHK